MYGEPAPSERGTILRLQVYDRVGVLLFEVHKSLGKSVISVCKDLKGLAEGFYGCKESRETFLLL